MKYQNQKRLRWLTAVFILTLFTLTIFTSTAEAQDFFYGTVVAAGENVANDVVLNGDTLRVDGTVDGDLFAFGRKITINGTVTGSSVIVGEEVVINGTIEGSLYIIALSFQLEDEANIGRSVYFLGFSIDTMRGSQISRDLNFIAVTSFLEGSVGRTGNSTQITGLYNIVTLILDWFNVLNTGKNTASGLIIDERAKIPIRLVPASIIMSNSMAASGVQAQVDTETADEINDWLNRFMQGLVSFLIVGGLAIWLWPRPFDNWVDQVRARPLRSFGWGVVAYIVGFVGAVILAVVIMALAAFLGYLSLWQLALTWLGLALSGLGVGFWTFILFLAFMSKAIVAYVIGSWIFSKVYPRANGRHLWPLLLGLLIYTLICMVAVLGWVFGFIVTCLGLGAVWQVIRGQRRREDGEAGTAVAAEAAAKAAV